MFMFAAFPAMPVLAATSFWACCACAFVDKNYKQHNMMYKYNTEFEKVILEWW